jgi:2-keto-3-deoxy-L-rhamnonate aldolase
LHFTGPLLIIVIAIDSMAALPPPPGVYVPVPTFFVRRSDPQYNAVAPPLDVKTQAAHSIHLAKCGIRGLVILGSTGEAVALTNPERSLLLSSVREELERAGFKDYPIIAGTATQSIAETVQQLVEAKEASAQWGLCLAPGYFAGAVTQEGLIRWYTAVADQSPIPIMMFVILAPYPTLSSFRLYPAGFEAM